MDANKTFKKTINILFFRKKLKKKILKFFNHVFITLYLSFEISTLYLYILTKKLAQKKNTSSFNLFI